MPDNAPNPESATPRAIHLALVAVIGLAFVGFFVGIRQGTTVPELEPPAMRPLEAHPAAIPSMAYADFDRRIHGPNRNWKSSLADLKQPLVDLLEKRTPSDTTERMIALAARAERRAFDGAPPVVPHPIDQMNTSSCMACHEHGFYIGKGISAPMMSHEYLPNCTQCHVEMHSPDLPSFTLAANTFEGKPAPLGGPRAWDGAPPMIPHATIMRENCLSCHGPGGADPIRTTHPWRTNCTQCHAPSAVLDQIAPSDTLRLIESSSFPY